MVELDHSCPISINGVYWVKDKSKKKILINNKIDTSFKKYILKRAKYLFFDAEKKLFDFKQLSSPTEKQKNDIREETFHQ
jgi:hypothetical protein